MFAASLCRLRCRLSPSYTYILTDFFNFYCLSHLPFFQAAKFVVFCCCCFCCCVCPGKASGDRVWPQRRPFFAGLPILLTLVKFLQNCNDPLNPPAPPPFPTALATTAPCSNPSLQRPNPTLLRFVLWMNPRVSAQFSSRWYLRARGSS